MWQGIKDPVELTVAEGLTQAGVKFERDTPRCHRLDFYLPDYDVYIECKQFHTPRVLEQMSRVRNIIVVQGLTSARCLASLLGVKS